LEVDTSVLFYFLLQCVKFWRTEKFSKGNVESITQFFDIGYSRIFASLVKYSLYG